MGEDRYFHPLENSTEEKRKGVCLNVHPLSDSQEEHQGENLPHS